MRAVTGKKKNAASSNTIGRFETRILPLQKKLESLSEINGRWITKAMESRIFSFAKLIWGILVDGLFRREKWSEDAGQT